PVQLGLEDFAGVNGSHKHDLNLLSSVIVYDFDIAWPALTLRPHIGIDAMRQPSTQLLLMVMLLAERRRYAAWTLCLMVIALDLGMHADEAGWAPAGDLILLTAGGLALARVFTLCLPRARI